MKISIITVTWNSSATLRDTMQSVLSQSHADIEHIIVDGGSTDGTMDIVHELEPHYNGKLRYVSEKDKGLYDAMNKGIAMATGEVVGLLNSDDFYTSSDVLLKVDAAFEKSGIDAVYGDIHFVKATNLQKCVRYYSSKPFRRGWMRFGFMPAHPSFYCRREVYEQYGAFDLSYKIGSDFECLLRFIFVHNIRLQYLPLDFVTMRTGGASTSGWRSHKQILLDHQRAFKKNGVYSNVLFEALRYVYKVMEIVVLKCSRR